MRLLIVTEAWDPQVNGVVRTLKMTRRELQRAGHEVHLLTPDRFRSIPCPTYPDIRLALATRKAVEAEIDRIAPQCLHIATEGPLGWAARAVALRRGWPFTTAYHSRFPEYVQARLKTPVSWIYPALRRFHNTGRGTLVPTPVVRDLLVSRGFTQTRLWTRGVDHETFTPYGDREREPGRHGSGPVFLYVGRLAVEKQVDHFLELDLPGELWVAGTGPAEAALRQRYPRARWLGVLSGPDLARLYRSAEVLVFPSVTDTFGLVMLEAMACGTPVAAYPVPGPLDVVANGTAGVLHEDLRQASLQALQLDRTAVAQYAQRFNWGTATAQFMSALHPFDGSRLAPAGTAEAASA